MQAAPEGGSLAKPLDPSVQQQTEGPERALPGGLLSKALGLKGPKAQEPAGVEEGGGGGGGASLVEKMAEAVVGGGGEPGGHGSSMAV